MASGYVEFCEIFFLALQEIRYMYNRITTNSTKDSQHGAGKTVVVIHVYVVNDSLLFS